MPSTKNLTMGDLMERFRCEEACRDYLEKLRWPEGVTCLRCGSETVYAIPERNQYQCGEKECRYHFSVMTGTKLKDTKLPLWKWFLAVFLMIHAKKGISAKQLHRMLGGSYKTCWLLCHKIREAMREQDDEPLGGEVEVDETFLGGRATGVSGPQGKTVVMGAASRDGRIRLKHMDNRTKAAIHAFVDEHVADDATLYTDSYKAYTSAAKKRKLKHRKVNHSRKQWVNGQVHTNTVEGVWSLLDRSIIGAFHKVSTKHLQRYLEEVEWKYNNRNNPYLFRETLEALIATEPMEYRDLISSSAS